MSSIGDTSGNRSICPASGRWSHTDHHASSAEQSRLGGNGARTVSDDDNNGEARTFEGRQRKGMKATSLENRTVLVTGAASGFGRSMALGLLTAGARVALTDVSAQHLKAVAAEVRSFGNRTAVFAADLANAEQVNQLIHTLGPFRTVDVVINNA